MHASSVESHAALAVQLTRAATVFDGIANGLINTLRHALGVPEKARADIERELLRLRARLDGLYPEYQELFGGLLLEHIGPRHAASVLAALCSEPIQEYFRAAPRVDAELQALLVELGERMSRVAREAPSLARTVRGPSPLGSLCAPAAGAHG
jgi:hypothetical protein